MCPRRRGTEGIKIDGIRTFGDDCLSTLNAARAILIAVWNDCGVHGHSQTTKREPTVVGEIVRSNRIEGFPQKKRALCPLSHLLMKGAPE